MGHAITAIITKNPIDENKAKELDLACFHEKNVTIIGLDTCHSEFWAKQFGIYDDSSDFFGYPAGVFVNSTLKLAEAIGISKFALITTDYFGGIGVQAGRVFINNKEVILDGYNSDDALFKGVTINATLKYIGVKKSLFKDEFDTINLSKYRSFDSYYDNYECND